VQCKKTIGFFAWLFYFWLGCMAELEFGVLPKVTCFNTQDYTFADV